MPREVYRVLTASYLKALIVSELTDIVAMFGGQ